MSSKQCIECGTKRKLFSFNYAGFDIRSGNFHPFPERIQTRNFPGNKADSFLCGDCANKRDVSCSVHGSIDDNFALGVPPRCGKCSEEVKANIRDLKIQAFWVNNYPAAENNIHLKLLYTRGGLACSILDSDGSIEESEENALNSLPDIIRGKEGFEYEAFCAGFNDCCNKKVGISQFFENCSQFKETMSNNNTIKMLLHIASANGCLDKGEYNLIRKVALSLDIAAPDFDVLATKLNLNTSSIQRDQIIDIAKAIGIGALIVGGTALRAVLESEVQPASSSKSTGPTKAEVPRESKISGSRKDCGTCMYWGGVRSASKDKFYVIVASTSIRGKCGTGRHAKSERSASQSCNDWHKWPGVK